MSVPPAYAIDVTTESNSVSTANVCRSRRRDAGQAKHFTRPICWVAKLRYNLQHGYATLHPLSIFHCALIQCKLNLNRI